MIVYPKTACTSTKIFSWDQILHSAATFGKVVEIKNFYCCAESTGRRAVWLCCKNYELVIVFHGHHNNYKGNKRKKGDSRIKRRWWWSFFIFLLNRGRLTRIIRFFSREKSPGPLPVVCSNYHHNRSVLRARAHTVLNIFSFNYLRGRDM